MIEQIGIPSGSASRILAALHALAAGAPTVAASYDEIAAMAERSRPVVAAGLRELIETGWVEQRKAYGQKAIYTFEQQHIEAKSEPASSPQPCSSSVVKPSSSVVNPPFTSEPSLVKVFRTTARSVIRSGTGTGTGGGTRAVDFSESPETAGPESPEPEPPRAELAGPVEAESPAVQRARALLREFNVGEPTQTELARALEMRFEADEPTVRRICEKTREDWHRGWARSPIGLTVSRIRRFMAGEQLSFLAELGQPTLPAATKQPRHGGSRRRSGGSFRMKIVEYTEEQRRQIESEAREKESARLATPEGRAEEIARLRRRVSMAESQRARDPANAERVIRESEQKIAALMAITEATS